MLFKHKKKFSSSEGDQTLAQAAQRGCRGSVYGESQSLTGRGPAQPAPADPALSRIVG